jgi:hypothetical protein
MTDSATRRFVQHYVEMVIAMLVGMSLWMWFRGHGMLRRKDEYTRAHRNRWSRRRPAETAPERPAAG